MFRTYLIRCISYFLFLQILICCIQRVLHRIFRTETKAVTFSRFPKVFAVIQRLINNYFIYWPRKTGFLRKDLNFRALSLRFFPFLRSRISISIFLNGICFVSKTIVNKIFLFLVRAYMKIRKCLFWDPGQEQRTALQTDRFKGVENENVNNFFPQHKLLCLI